MTTTTADLAGLHSALSSLRVALPVLLVGILALRWLAKGFVAVMGRIQSQGWTIDDDEYAPPDRVAAAANGGSQGSKGANGNAYGDGAGHGAPIEQDGESEDEVMPVVVKHKTVRRILILTLAGLTAVTYFGEGIAQGEPCPPPEAAPTLLTSTLGPPPQS